MKIVFVSNYFNHHQKPLSDALYRLTGGEFVFISTTEMREERRLLGYSDDDTSGYVLLSYMNEENKKLAQMMIDGADVVIAGSAPEKMLKNRIKSGKTVFRYSERLHKSEPEPLKYLPRLILRNIQNPRNKPIYLLCAGAYTYADYRKYGLFRDRAYKWGYFPEVRKHDIEKLISKKQPNSILWCGRFLDWKHPDDVIKAARRLKDEGYCFSLKMIGRGEAEDKIADTVTEYGLSDCVELIGSLPHERVREYMEKAQIYLFTSDRREGWGAVLNESMNSGCAVVASHAAGAVPYLIENGKNGSVYRSGDADMLCEKIKELLDDAEKRAKYGKNAYETVVNTWNAETAAERFMELASNLSGSAKSFVDYESGPCSRAEIISDDWM